MDKTNETPAHIHHRIAEAVGRGWPGWEVSEADVAQVLEAASPPSTIEREKRWPRGLIEAVLAEASEYGLAPA
jgi:hypothetical protein